jgi:hypothetical protein
MQTKGTTMIFGGMARLPKEFTDAEVFQVIAEVDAATGKVLEVEIVPHIPLILKLLKPMMVGMSLKNDYHDLLTAIEQQLFHRTKKAVIVAVKDMVREYRESQMPKPVFSSSPDPYNR